MSVINPIEGELMPAEPAFASQEPFPVDDSVDPLAVIKTTQSIRIAMVKNELKGGIPRLGTESRDLMQLLRDLDGAALTTRKLDVEERQVDESQRLADAQNGLLRMLGGKNPFAVDITQGAQAPRVERDDRNRLPAPVIVPDVMTQGTQAVNYDDFVSSVEESERLLMEEEEEDGY